MLVTKIWHMTHSKVNPGWKLFFEEWAWVCLRPQFIVLSTMHDNILVGGNWQLKQVLQLQPQKVDGFGRSLNKGVH